MEGSDDAIFSSSLRGLITSWNPGAHHLFGYTAGEAIGRPLSMLIPAEHAEEGPECLASIARGDRVRSFHTVRLRKEGQLVQVSVTISPIMDVQGQVVGASEIAREITDTKPAVAKLSEGEARFQQLADHLPAVFWVIDASNQRVVFVNSAYDSVWGQPRQSLQANPLAWLEAVNPVDRRRVHEALKKKRPAGNYDETYCITRPDGAQRWIRDRAYPVRNKSGKIERFVGMAEDITEQREIEEQLRQIQKMEAVSHLAGGLARDLNNIFAVMHAYTAILLAQKGIDADTTEQLRQMARVADRATVLPSQLLTFSHKQILRPTSVDLNQIVATTAKKLQETIAADICLRLECPPNLPHLRADAAMIEQALMNLGLNARDAMPRGGQITISTSISTLDGSALGAHPQGRPGTFVTLKVADSGSGMSPEVMAHLFEPFFTTKRSGEDVGLGLATVLSIIQQHRGWVEAQSVAGQGASFTIFLPCGDPDPGAVATDDGRAEVLGGTETILIVEDDARVRRVALKALERFGYRVLSASSGVAALSLWNSQAEGIDVLVTDLVRPYGMSGAELAAKLRVFKPDLKIIFTSGYAVDEVDLDVELKAGVTLLLKPYGPEKLAKVVRQSLDS